MPLHTGLAINFCLTCSEGGRWYVLTGLTCEQALPGALAAGREKEGELATASLEFEFYLQFLCGSPSTELSDFHQSARSGYERLLDFSDADIQIPERQLQALLPFPAPSPERPGELVCRLNRSSILLIRHLS